MDTSTGGTGPSSSIVNTNSTSISYEIERISSDKSKPFIGEIKHTENKVIKGILSVIQGEASRSFP